MFDSYVNRSMTQYMGESCFSVFHPSTRPQFFRQGHQMRSTCDDSILNIELPVPFTTLNEIINCELRKEQIGIIYTDSVDNIPSEFSIGLSKIFSPALQQEKKKDGPMQIYLHTYSELLLNTLEGLKTLKKGYFHKHFQLQLLFTIATLLLFYFSLHAIK